MMLDVSNKGGVTYEEKEYEYTPYFFNHDDDM